MAETAYDEELDQAAQTEIEDAPSVDRNFNAGDMRKKLRGSGPSMDWAKGSVGGIEGRHAVIQHQLAIEMKYMDYERQKAGMAYDTVQAEMMIRNAEKQEEFDAEMARGFEIVRAGGGTSDAWFKAISEVPGLIPEMAKVKAAGLFADQREQFQNEITLAAAESGMRVKALPEMKKAFMANARTATHNAVTEEARAFALTKDKDEVAALLADTAKNKAAIEAAYARVEVGGAGDDAVEKLDLERATRQNQIADARQTQKLQGLADQTRSYLAERTMVTEGMQAELAREAAESTRRVENVRRRAELFNKSLENEVAEAKLKGLEINQAERVRGVVAESIVMSLQSKPQFFEKAGIDPEALTDLLEKNSGLTPDVLPAIQFGLENMMVDGTNTQLNKAIELMQTPGKEGAGTRKIQALILDWGMKREQTMAAKGDALTKMQLESMKIEEQALDMEYQVYGNRAERLDKVVNDEDGKMKDWLAPKNATSDALKGYMDAFGRDEVRSQWLAWGNTKILHRGTEDEVFVQTRIDPITQKTTVEEVTPENAIKRMRNHFLKERAKAQQDKEMLGDRMRALSTVMLPGQTPPAGVVPAPSEQTRAGGRVVTPPSGVTNPAASVSGLLDGGAPSNVIPISPPTPAATGTDN